jgi:prophage regulatory protein
MKTEQVGTANNQELKSETNVSSVGAKATLAKKLVLDQLHVSEELGSTVVAGCIREVCLRIGAVSSITGLSVPTIYREIGQDRFPRPIKITAGARAWLLSEIMEWIETREREES